MKLLNPKKRIVVREWRVEGKRLVKRTEGKSEIKYRKEMDSYYAPYKNAEIPLKHNYINDSILDVINYENSFIPFRTMDIEIKRIDNMKSLSLPKNASKEQIEKYLKNTSTNPEIAIKACAVPMEIRSWFIANNRRLMLRSQGWFQKYGNIVLFLIFASLTIAVIQVSFNQAGELSTSVIKASADAFFDGVQIQISNVTSSNTATGTVAITPP